MFVYKITNTVDNKVYIGGTKMSLPRRLANHKSDARGGNQKMLSVHMREVGLKNFTISMISQHDNITKDELRKLEQAEIDKMIANHGPTSLLNVLAAYQSDSGDRVEYYKRYETEMRDEDQKRLNRRVAYRKMMNDPVRAEKERSRNRDRMRIKRSSQKPVQRLNGCGHEETSQSPVIA